MPMQTELYPPDWKRIAFEKKQAAGWRCEFCGKRCRKAGEPKRGEWVRVEDEESYHYECSRCGERPLYSRYGDVVLSGVCPLCGADMRKMEETEDEVHSDI